MIKKKIIMGFVLISIFILCSCETSVENNNEISAQEDLTQEVSTTVLTEEKLKWLIDENIYCNLNVFGMNSLPGKENAIEHEGRTLYPVDESVFADFATFEEYVRSVYCDETASLYLYESPYPNEPLYVNVDGKLYVDMRYAGGKGYYVDWSGYSFEIKNQDENRCEFTVTASIEEPGEVSEKVPYTVECVAVFENGRWVSEKMIY